MFKLETLVDLSCRNVAHAYYVQQEYGVYSIRIWGLGWIRFEWAGLLVLWGFPKHHNHCLDSCLDGPCGITFVDNIGPLHRLP